MPQNICRFIPSYRINDSINIVNYVLETQKQPGDNLLSVYRMHLVVSGEGILRAFGKEYPLAPGDIFVIFPGVTYTLDWESDIQYLYISYLGQRGNALMDMLGIQSTPKIFHGFSQLIPMWQEGIAVTAAVSGLRGESVLLFTFSVLADAQLCREQASRDTSDPAQLVKKYVDEHFSDPELTLGSVSAAFSYHPKYISTVFKQTFQIGFSEYLNTVRIQHAHVLICQGFTSVQSIAMLCGYRDAMYFSKLFRARVGLSPRNYIQEHRK